MTLTELGAHFKSVRLSKDKSIEDVVNTLKISKRIVTAIEEGDIENLPEPPFTRGFIKSYAQLLGIPDEDALIAYADEYHEKIKFVPVNTKESQQYDALMPNNLQALKTVIRLLIFLFIVFIFYMLISVFLKSDLWADLSKMTSQTEETIKLEVQPEEYSSEIQWAEPDADVSSSDIVIESSETENSSLLANNNLENENSSIENKESGQVKLEEIAKDTLNKQENTLLENANQELSTDTEKTKQNSELTLNKEEEKSTNTEEASLANNTDQVDIEKIKLTRVLGSGEQYVILTAQSPCWMRITTDGKILEGNYTLQKGKSIRVNFNKSTKLQLGNVSGVDVIYNGVPQKKVKNASVSTLSFPN